MSHARTLFAVLCPALLSACDGAEPPTAVAPAVPRMQLAGASAAGAAVRIAFASNRDGGIGGFDIYTMDPDGLNLQRLTSDAAIDREPAQSPDRSRILFSSNRDGNFEIYVMNADGTGQTNLSDSDRDDRRASWSPDGSRIAFASERSGNSDIYVMDAEGNDVVQLTDDPFFDSTPVWSPDGKHIAFVSNRDGDLDIFVMNADGTGETNLTDNEAVENDPAWTPDGRIGFTSDRDAIYSSVYVMDADGMNVEQLTSGASPDDQPAWSPDGTRIAFVRNVDIWVMNADGTSQLNVTKNASTTIANENPDWGVPLAVDPPVADLAIVGNAGRGQGRTVVYTIAVTNLGPDGASGVRLTSVLPAAARFVAVSTTQGSCSAPAVGSSGSVECALGAIADGGKVTTQITVKVVPGNARPSVGASVTSASLDPVPANSSATIAAP